jgi:hypothetical protein
MDVERAARRDVEHCLRKNQAVGRDDENVGRHGSDARVRHSVAQRFRLEDFETARLCQPLHRTGCRTHAAPGRTIGLSKYQRDLVARVEQRGQRALGELRGARED